MALVDLDVKGLVVGGYGHGPVCDIAVGVLLDLGLGLHLGLVGHGLKGVGPVPVVLQAVQVKVVLHYDQVIQGKQGSVVNVVVLGVFVDRCCSWSARKKFLFSVVDYTAMIEF